MGRLRPMIMDATVARRMAMIREPPLADIIMPEILRPSPVRVNVPTIKPAAARSMATGRTFFPPSMTASTILFGVSQHILRTFQARFGAGDFGGQCFYGGKISHLSLFLRLAGTLHSGTCLIIARLIFSAVKLGNQLIFRYILTLAYMHYGHAARCLKRQVGLGRFNDA